MIDIAEDKRTINGRVGADPGMTVMERTMASAQRQDHPITGICGGGADHGERLLSIVIQKGPKS